jgi:signal transduction histidine kinase
MRPVLTSVVNESASDEGRSASSRLLYRSDLILLPILFVFDSVVFSRLLQPDAITATQRWFILGYSAAGIAVLAVRRRWPVAVFAALLAMTVPAYLLIDFYFPLLLLLVALAAVAQYRSVLVSSVCLLFAFIPGVLFVRKAVAEASPDGMLASAVGSGTLILLVTSMAWVIGRWLHLERRRIRELQEENHTRQREAIVAERLHIAREMHDIVAHAVTIMVLQAAGAKAIAPAQPARLREILDGIESSGQEAMAELRRLLGLLRGDPAVVAGDARLGEFMAGLADLEGLLDSVRASGADLRVEIRGVPHRVDRSIDHAAFRLIQEGLTNVAKHAGPAARAVVCIDWDPHRLTVSVEDDGGGCESTPEDAPHQGVGLAGLSERIAILGGTFAAEPGPDGGYRLAARFPTDHRQATGRIVRPNAPTGSAVPAEP